MNKKYCPTCKKIKSVLEFNKSTARKDGLNWQCRNCYKKLYKLNKKELKKYHKEYYIKNKQKILKQKRIYVKNNTKKIRNYYLKNITKIKEYHKIYYINHKKEIDEYKKINKEKIHKQQNLYSKIHKNRRREYQKYYNQTHKNEIARKYIIYRNKNRLRIQKYQKKYFKNKMKIDINFKISFNLRRRIRSAIKAKHISQKIMCLLGCSIEQLKQHLQSQFKQGMTWENYGFYGWHIDHKIPCASFDLSKPSEQRKCFNFTNLQPLWMKENISKGNKIL
jgi:hypothetical protein